MDSRLIKSKALPKPLLLKDYLLDDMSSCSSNGFKSFPRRQCCTSTLRFLIEIDHKNKQVQNNNNNKKMKNYLNFEKTQQEAIPKLSRSKSALSALQGVIAAVKRIPFAAGRSPGHKNYLKKKSLFLPRSLSVKILKKSGFWKRKSSHKEIGRWKSLDQLLKDDPEPSGASTSFSPMTRSDGNSKSWSGNDFTASDECTSGNSHSNMDLPDQVRNDAVELLKNGDVSSDSITNTDSSNAITTTNSSTQQKQWSVNEDKEQLSPVSVMDCPFDDDEEVSSPFQHGLSRMEGTQKKVMKKMKRLSSLEPMSLAKQFELHKPNSSNKSTRPIEDEEADDDDDVEKQALNLLDQMDKTSLLVPPNGLKIKADRLLLDFFREKIIAHSPRGQCCSDRELLEEAGNWINERKPRELFLGWELSKNREAYIKDMDKTKEWKLYDQESYKEVAVELGAEIFDALLNELLLDISS